MPELLSTPTNSITKQIEEKFERQDTIPDKFQERQLQYPMLNEICPTTKLNEAVEKTQTTSQINMFLMSHSPDWVYLNVCIIDSKTVDEIGNNAKGTQLNGTPTRNQTVMLDNHSNSTAILGYIDSYDIDIKQQVP